MLGRTIGNYEIVSPFGEGGMGELYLGRHSRLVAREVIIKTIRTEDFSPRQVEHLRERLEREAFVQSQLDHPNIVRVYDFIASGDTTCIIMEYVPGRDLRKMITRETGPIPDYRALKLFKQVLAAIDYAHNFIYLDKSGARHQGIIHRDLKPANILVTPDDVVKVTDFGIVKVRGVKGGTQMGFNPGTPEYMSPEQARGRELDHRSDIYAMGVVLYEMLTGRVPFEGDGSGTSDYEIRRGHIEMAVPAMSEFYPGISPELEKIVLKALEKNPDDRFQTARQFLELLEEYELTGTAKVTGRMLGARQTLLAEGRGTARQSLADAPTVGIGNTVVTDPSRGSGSMPRLNNSSASSSPANSAAADIYSRQKAARQAAEQKSKLPLIIGVAVTMLAVIGISSWLLTRPVKPPVITPTGGAPTEMKAIPGGRFMMGRNDGSEFEKPAHEVTVAPFFIDTYEVTNEQYAEFVRRANRNIPDHWVNGAPPSGEDRFPVVNVTWYDARDYCEWRGKRLPTEEEWEFAARGRENLLYPYGNQWKPQFSSASPSPEQIGKLSAVGSYPGGASPFGVLDMAGNVAEWTVSDYRPYPGSPAKPDEGNKIQRGGSFINLPSEQTATDRFFNLPVKKFDYIGFRCAKDAK
ncbi:MAG: SUMF1/EgtB/PvdO family nonheme iron enzyme [Acidobacteria bacterium]|nr:SUMF1/EgtB/PvdO family nonheme iron enzyme [Acidobacteriota bacterium]